MSKLTDWKKIEEKDGRILWETKNSKGIKVFRWAFPQEVPNDIHKVGVLESKRFEPMELEIPETKENPKGSEKKHEFKLATSGKCDHCGEEVKYFPPQCKKDICIENKKDIELNHLGVPECLSCHDKLRIMGTQCSKCSYYVPAPGETFDASRVNFNMSDFLSKVPEGKLLVTSKHEMPCPASQKEDISKDPDVNEWILNHLPLTEEQKKGLLNQLTLEKSKEERQEKREKEMAFESARLKEKRLQKPKLKREETRMGVKHS